jgi:hypothetical protein
MTTIGLPPVDPLYDPYPPLQPLYPYVTSNAEATQSDHTMTPVTQRKSNNEKTYNHVSNGNRNYNNKNMNNKIIVCRFFMQNRCNKGDSCKFSHNIE